MKKILLGLVATFALSTLAAPAFAGDAPPAAGDAAADAKPAKKAKAKKAAKKDDKKPEEAAPAK